MNGASLPYLTADLPGIGGKIKTIPADFYVEEIPLYETSGSGQHVYLTLEKTGMTTLKAINIIAEAVGVHRRTIGYAGLKDAQAVTRQTISIDNVPVERVNNLAIAGIKIIAVSRHQNKLKLGHLRGNRFVIRVRQVGQEGLARAEAILARLSEQGVPNYFGQQRFGLRHNSHLLGLALIQNNIAEFIAGFLGRPDSRENPQAQRARALFEAGDWAEALAAWPPMLREERIVLQNLVRSGDEAAALRSLDGRLKRLFVSACQSELFNQLLLQRLSALSRIEAGDVAYLHRNGACFVVQSPADEQPRVDNFEISPAGPLFGVKYLAAQGEPGAREAAVLRGAGISLADFNVPGANLGGSRRPYRIPLNDVNFYRDDEGIVLSFTLPPGSYATMVLGEVMKTGEGEE